MNYSEKLDGFPTVHYPSLVEFPERREFMQNQFAKFGITKAKLFLTERYNKIKDQYLIRDPNNFLNPEKLMGHPGNMISYLTLMKDWYDNTEEEYAIFCDDDIDFMSIDYWNFSWKQFVDALPHNWQCIQLIKIKEWWQNSDEIVYGRKIIPALKLTTREWDDWGTAALIKRAYVKKILDRHYINANEFDTVIIGSGTNDFFIWPLIENILFRELDNTAVYNFPLFQENPYFYSFLHPNPTAQTLEEHKKIVESNRGPHVVSRETYETLWRETGMSTSLNTMIDPAYNKKPFSWGDVDPAFVEYVATEIWGNNIYQKIQPVKENDVVVDIGASCGAFGYSILDKKPKHIYCFEPSKNFYDLLKSNLDYPNVSCINKAIVSDIHPKQHCILFWQDKEVEFETVTFNKFIREYNINKMDFLKIDCEGGEYSIFTDDNIHFLTNNVKHIACEFHFVEHQNAYNYKYVNFLKTYLPRFKTFKAFTQSGIDITNTVLNIEKIGNENGQVMFYLLND